MEKVIYLSFAQGTNIDGSLLAKSVSAVMVRAGQGTWEDPLFRYNYRICVDNHIPFGIWWFCQPNMSAIYQVNAFMKVWNTLEVKPIVIAYDVEEIDYKDDNGIWRKLFPPSRQFNHDNVLSWCKQIAALTGAKVGIYTRKNYFESWTFETPEWYQFWLWIAAWYLYSGNVPPLLPWNWPTYKVHQYEGGGQGTPGVDPAQTCKEYFNGTHLELLDFFGVKQEPVMTAIYNTKVPQTQRAKILTLRGDQTLTVPTSELGIDAVILPMGTMHNWTTNKHWRTKTEATFAGRCDLFRGAGIPVFGKFDLDAGALIAEQHGLDEFKNRTIKDNFILPFLINAWHIGDWTWDTIFAKQGQFRKLNALIISEVEITPWGEAYPNGEWNQAIWDYVVDHLRTLMANGQVPTVPIIMYTGGWWLHNYPKEMNDIELNNNKSWLYLQLGKWINYSTATFNNLNELFSFRPAENFNFKMTNSAGDVIWDVPAGYNDRVLMHEFTGEAQKVKQITDVNGIPTPVNLSLWNDTKEEMYRFLELNTIPPPSPPPTPINFKSLDDAILVIDTELQKIKTWRSTL